MADSIEKIETIVGEKRILFNESLQTHTVIKSPQIAQYYLEIDNQHTFIKVINAARAEKLPVYILGGGSRTYADKKMKGLVIKNSCRKFDTVGIKGGSRQQENADSQVLVYAESGVNVNQLVRYTIEEGLEGLEYQLGLPGTIGGAIYTNAKYIPKYLLLNNALQSISILGKDGKIQSFTQDLPHFVYTDEKWEETEDIILSAVFKLRPQDKKVLWQRGEEAVAWREVEGKKRLEQS